MVIMRQFTCSNDMTAATDMTSYEVQTSAGTGGNTLVWNMNYDHGTGWRENGFRDRYETQTTTSSAQTLRIAQAEPMQVFTLGQEEGIDLYPNRPHYSEIELDYTGRMQWTNFTQQTTNGIPNERWINEGREVDELFGKVDIKKLSKEDLILYNARLKSEKLLKKWLSATEYNALKTKGEVAIPHPDDDNVIFIVKKHPTAMVSKMVKGKHESEQCIVTHPDHRDIPVGDKLLQKILLIKSDPKKFLEIANTH